MSDLVKEAISPAAVAAMSKAVRGLGSGAGVGGLLGAAGGTVLGGVHGYNQARGRGEGLGSAASSGFRGGLRGAAQGATAGALLGGVAGAAAPSAALRLSSHGALGGASRFGQRQVHSLTGVGDAAYVRSIGGGAAGARQALVDATRGLKEAPDAAARAKAMGAVGSARKQFKASEKSEAMGLTSIPGYLTSLAKNPKETLVTGIRDQWSSMGTGGKALMAGAPAVGAAHELLRKGEGEERGRFERAGRVIGGAASGLTMPLALAGDLVAGGGLSMAGGRMGRMLDRLKSRRGSLPTPPAVAQQSQEHGSAQPASYEYSDRAAGTTAEGMTG